MDNFSGRRETSITDEARDWFGGGGGELDCEYPDEREDDCSSYDDEGDHRYHSDKHEAA